MNRLTLSVILLVAVIGLAVKNMNNKPKISPVETAQATVATPVEETSNKQVETGVVIHTRIQFGVGSTNSQNN